VALVLVLGLGFKYGKITRMDTQRRQEPRGRLERQGESFSQKTRHELEASCTTPKNEKRCRTPRLFLRKDEWNAGANERREGATNAQSAVVKSMELLACTHCNATKPATAEFFPLHNKKRNGFDSWCRACRATYRSATNRGKFRAVMTDDALANLKSSTSECVICGSAETLVVDHDHATGKVRGMLCNHCNRGLGHFRDDPMLLEFAAQYLYASVDHPEWDKYRATTEAEC